MSPLLLFIWGVALLFVPGYLIAFCFAKPRETRGSDEFYYFVICALGVSTGSGAFEIVAFLAGGHAIAIRPRRRSPIALSFSIGLPYTWRPTQMDNHFRIPHRACSRRHHSPHRLDSG